MRAQPRFQIQLNFILWNKIKKSYKLIYYYILCIGLVFESLKNDS